jgi:hypothetical protein
MTTRGVASAAEASYMGEGARRGGEEAEQAIGAEKKIFKNFGLN